MADGAVGKKRGRGREASDRVNNIEHHPKDKGNYRKVLGKRFRGDRSGWSSTGIGREQDCRQSPGRSVCPHPRES